MEMKNEKELIEKTVLYTSEITHETTKIIVESVVVEVRKNKYNTFFEAFVISTNGNKYPLEEIHEENQPPPLKKSGETKN